MRSAFGDASEIETAKHIIVRDHLLGHYALFVGAFEQPRRRGSGIKRARSEGRRSLYITLPNEDTAP